MVKQIFVTCLLFVFFNHAMANTQNTNNNINNNLNETIQASGLINVGEATFSVLFWDIYKSRLQTTSGNYTANSPTDIILYEINYLRDITRNELIQRTVEQWQHLKVKPDLYEKHLTKLQAIWPNITNGDTLALLVTTDKSVFYFNNDFIGDIQDPQFGSLFLDIWLSEKTSQPALRKKLLGEK